MLKSSMAMGTIAAGVMVLGAGIAHGQSISTGAGPAYPVKPIRIVTSEPGSGNDLAARVIALGLSGSLGQQVITDNRGIMAIAIAASAPSDGYTLLVYGSTFWYAPFLRSNVPWHPVRDFAPITLAVSSPSILVVPPSLAAKSVKDLIALAKSRPGELNYGSASTGSALHLAAELFKAMAGVNIVRIPYKGNGQAIAALIGEEVQMVFSSAGVVMPQVKSGRLRALAASSAQPSALAPGLPTVAASGLPGFESVTMVGAFAPVRTSAALIRRLNQEIVQVLNRADVKERLLSAGVETVGSSPEEFATKMKSEMARMGKVIKDAGIHGE